MANYPKLHLYVDDAHSTSWFGKCGRGWALDTLPDRSRVVVALSLNKAFSAGGGALIFPTEETRTKVRRCGGPMLFSGPVPPPMLGAAVASAELHLRSDFLQHQEMLASRIQLVLALAREHGIQFVANSQSPIFFVQCGYLGAIRLAQSLRNRGAYVSPGGFPAVSKGQEGIRFTVSLNNTEDDIRSFMKVLASERRKLDEVAPEAMTST
jgi:7-keto-8-aminopelargonate synthetase-like enzyme